MEAKISELDASGVVVESETFKIPLTVEYAEKTIKLSDGTVILMETTGQRKYLLEINGYEYILYNNGYMHRVGEE